MPQDAVRDAYAARAAEYIELFDRLGPRDEADAALIRRHLTGLPGRVLDLGCGPGHWSGYLHALGADVTGVDLVPAFVAHARATHPGPEFLLGSMHELPVAGGSVSGVLSWYSTIHLPPPELDRALAGFRRLLGPADRLVIGFFDSDDDVAAFDHKVTTAYRWPADVLAERLGSAGFVEVERLQQRFPDRPDRAYAAIAAHAR